MLLPLSFFIVAFLIRLFHSFAFFSSPRILKISYPLCIELLERADKVFGISRKPF